MEFSDKDARMETGSELAWVLEELKAREPIFHRPEWGTTRTDFERMTAEDFWEVGASGRRYSREFVLDALERRRASPHEDPLEAFGFHCRRLSEDVYLLTYTLRQPEERWTRRATIWRRTSQGWEIVYHQGTVVQDL
jgi:hypothetical protein